MGRVDLEMVRVLLGSLDPLIARGIADALRADRCLSVLVCDKTAGALEDEVRRQTPAVLVVGESVEYAQLVRIRDGDSPPAMLVVVERTGLVGPLLVSVGISCVAAGASSRELLKTVRLTARGHATLLAAEASERLDRGHPAEVGHLTIREREVLDHLIDGCTNPEIAAVLQLSVGTVRTHVGRVLQKLDRQSRRALIGMAVTGRENGR
jgi:DNA-binding NarL/FixJ family response regulator